jgi:hypothetical protein
MPAKAAQQIHFAIGINAVADAFASTVYSDVVNAKGYSKIVFLAHHGVGATGTSTFTVLAGDDAANPPTNSTAIPFRYKVMSTSDTEGALTAATTSGFLSTAGSNQIYWIEVDVEELGDTGYQYCCLKAVEGTDSPRLGGVIILMFGGRYQQDVPATALT